MPAWSWTRRNTDDPLFPRRGNLIHVEAGFAVKGVLTDQTFIRGYARGQQYLPIGKEDLVLIRAELGGVFTSGSSSGIPASLLFRAGGSNSVRGYGYQSIGNNVDGSVLPTKYLVTASAEYQHWFTSRLGRGRVLRHRHRHRHLGRKSLLSRRRRRGALAQPGRPGQCRCRLRHPQQQRAAVSDAGHRLLMKTCFHMIHA